MTHHDNDNGASAEQRKRPFLNTPAGFVLCAFLAVGGLFLWLEHKAHILGALPLLLPLAICLGMHFFMHGGRGGHGGGRHER